MTTTEFRQIICSMYCERNRQGGDKCNSCSVNPEHTNNFNLGKTAVKMIEAGVQTDGRELLARYAEEVLAELEVLFGERS